MISSGMRNAKYLLLRPSRKFAQSFNLDMQSIVYMKEPGMFLSSWMKHTHLTPATGGLAHSNALRDLIKNCHHSSSLQWHFPSPNKCLLFLLFGSHYTMLFFDLPDSRVKIISKANWHSG
jgi:hypothetical protein